VLVVPVVLAALAVLVVPVVLAALAALAVLVVPVASAGLAALAVLAVPAALAGLAASVVPVTSGNTIRPIEAVLPMVIAVLQTNSAARRVVIH